MRLYQAILVSTLCLLLSGCSQHLYWLEITPEKRVLDGFDEDQDLRARIAESEQGPVVEGSKCNSSINTRSVREQSIHEAYQDAIRKAGSSYNALVNVFQTTTMYGPFVYCVSLKGTAVKLDAAGQKETYYKTSTASEGTPKPPSQ